MKLFCICFVLMSAVSTLGQSKARKQNLVPDVPSAERFGRTVVKDPSVVVRALAIAPDASASVPAGTRDYLLVSLGTSSLNATGVGNSFSHNLGDGEMQVIQGGWPHKLVNKGLEPSRLLAIEVPRNIAPQHALCGLGAAPCREVRFGRSENGEYSQTALFETRTTKLLRAQLGPKGTLALHHDSHKHLIVALTEFQGHSESDAISLKSGDVFLADAGMEELVNDGPAEARMLIVEIKN